MNARSHPPIRSSRRRSPSFRAITPLAALAFLTPFAGAAEVVRLDSEAAAVRAVRASHAAVAAAARSDGARSALEAADAAAYPTFTALASVAQRSAVPEYLARVGGPLEPAVVLYPNIETAYTASLHAHQVLYAGGAVEAGRNASRYDLDGSEAASRSVVADRALAGRLAYWEVVRANATFDAAAANEERAQRLESDTEALRAAGMAVNADLFAARSRVASAHVAVIRAETRQLDALAQLRSLLQIDADDTLELADHAAVPLPPAPATLAELQDEALSRRPELAEAASRLASLAARERLATAPARPFVALDAAWELSRPNIRYFPLSDEWNDSWSVGINAGWTLFDGGRSRSDARVVQAQQRAAAAEREELVRTVILEVEIARQGMVAALAAVGASDAARTAADERERSSRERLEAGLALMVEILDAQSELAAAEQQQIDTRAAAWIAAARLIRATGR